MGSDETRMLELRQMRATDERNHLHGAIGQVQRQYATKRKSLRDVQSKFRLLVDALKSGPTKGGEDRAKLELARFNAASLKNTNIHIVNSKKELLVLDRKRKDLSAEAAKVEMVRQKCQERIQAHRQHTAYRQDLSFEEELTEVKSVRRQNEANQSTEGASGVLPSREGAVFGAMQVSDGNVAYSGAGEVGPASTAQTQTRPQQQAPFEQIEQIQAWQHDGNTSMTLTYRLASGRALNIEASQKSGSVIQVSLAPEFQQDRKELVRERSRMLAALRDAGLKVDGVEIL